ncbi:hypothetical protein EX30DRAFT_313577 [Ascodesmis nigricans]|uniref:Intermediate filament protein n=1 Tax=Ascodesmis nigricans TaxID=341454 RepID=A0A4S2N667_9PEZI|nr:hypothetical protein EX30DRAFT_313577 [Ascodesmis nigricans]
MASIWIANAWKNHRPATVAAIICVGLLLNNAATSYIPTLRLIVWAFSAGVALALFLVLGAVVSFPDTNIPESPLRSVPPLAIYSPDRWSPEKAPGAGSDTHLDPIPLVPSSLPISAALDDLLSYVLRDFILAWYNSISTAPSFPNHVSSLIRHILSSTLERSQEVDLPQLLVARIAPLVTAHIYDFSEAEKAVRGKHLNKHLTESEELDDAIAGKYRDGRLHPAAASGFSNTKLAQQEHLRGLVETVLPSVLPKNEKDTQVVVNLVREIGACAILQPVLEMLSEPDTWNQLVVAWGKSALQDRKSVKKFREALEKHATPEKGRAEHTPPTQKGHPPMIRLSPNDDERMFERFIRSIRQCNNISDARRLRNEITAQLRRDGKIELGEEGVSPKWQVYIRRLETGKRLIDQKVSYLSQDGSAPGITGATESIPQPLGNESDPLAAGRINQSSRMESATLEDVLQDSAGLSYFMEYMDRQRRLPLVQFWLVVSGIRNPLEDDIPSDDEAVATISSSSFPAWTSSDRADIAQIHAAYLSSPRSEIQISEPSRRAIKDFLRSGDKATQKQYLRARSAVLRAQTAVYEEMNKNQFSGFRASDLFYKYLASDEAAGAGGNRNSSARPSLDVLPISAVGGSNTPSVEGEEEWDTDPLSGSITSLIDETALARNLRGARRKGGPSLPDRGVVEAVEAALNDIIDEPITNDNVGRNSPFDPASDSSRTSLEVPRDGTLSVPGGKNPQKKSHGKELSIASLGLIDPEARDTVFEDELFPEDNPGIESESLDEEYDSDTGLGGIDEDEIHLAAPGDLELAEAILTLSYEIQKLTSQEVVVDSLYRKAELTNNTTELRILRKSKASLQREIRRKELQKQQYIVQESDNSLYGRSTVSIKKSVVDHDNGQDYALYIVEVTRQGGEQLPAAQWAVARRYSEFFQLHQTLKRFESVKELDFPRRRVVMKLQKDFLEKRRVALDKYLKALLQIPEVCRSREFRAFLSSQSNTSRRHVLSPTPAGKESKQSTTDNRDLMSRLYASLADGMEDVIGNLALPPLPLLDQLTLPSQPASTPVDKDEITAVAEAEAELAAFEDKEVEPFVKPICDLFLEIFELNRKSNWLRGRAVVVVLHQLLGGTIERKVKEYVAGALEENVILQYIRSVKEVIWPGGELRRTDGEEGSKKQGRTEKEKMKTKKEAAMVMANLIPELSASVVGRANAQSASRRLFAVGNNHRLNTSIVYEILDEIVDAVFGTSATTQSGLLQSQSLTGAEGRAKI